MGHSVPPYATPVVESLASVVMRVRPVRKQCVTWLCNGFHHNTPAAHVAAFLLGAVSICAMAPIHIYANVSMHHQVWV